MAWASLLPLQLLLLGSIILCLICFFCWITLCLITMCVLLLLMLSAYQTKGSNSSWRRRQWPRACTGGGAVCPHKFLPAELRCGPLVLPHEMRGVVVGAAQLLLMMSRTRKNMNTAPFFTGKQIHVRLEGNVQWVRPADVGVVK